LNYQPNTQFSVFPPAIKHLLIINAIFFLALANPFLFYILTEFFALYPLQYGIMNIPIEGRSFYPWQLISYMFLHGSLGHVFFNLFALWIFGQNLENLWGTKRFVLYYFLTGIGAGIIHLLVSGSPVIGASGAVFGILLAFGMIFPNRHLYILFLPFPVKAKYFVIFYGVMELSLGISSLQTGIAHFAHLGGMVVGYFLIRYWKLRTNLE
jgi:membrane associated rhomboid family serine protease